MPLELFSLALLATGGIQSPVTNWVPFVIPWDDSTANTATDVSFLNVKPAGRNGRIEVRNGHWVEPKTGNRIRFFATNLGAGAAFPSKRDADKIAARLAKHGINLVRFHHLQNNWDVNGGMIWKRDKLFLELDPVQLDKIDYFVASLKKQGIYSNINLQTTRTYLPEMGLPASITLWKQSYGKKLDKIWPRMIQLQKEYARDLIARRNPYTGLYYKDDPAVLKIEINNENSLVGWPGEAPGAGLDSLPEPFRGYLKARWNDYLARKYRNDENLRQSWAAGSSTLGANLVKPDQSWTTENQSNADVTFNPGEPNQYSRPIEVDVRTVKGPDWHIQTHLVGLDLVEGKDYTLQFRAKADRARPIGVTVNLDRPDWHTNGLSGGVGLTTDFKTYALTFRAVGVDPGHARIAFVLGGSTGKVSIADVRLQSGRVSPNLNDGESIDKANIELVTASHTTQGLDYANFLSQEEANYSNGMRRYLRDELGFKKTQIIDTQISWGGTSAFVREAGMSYADNHAYWQHPNFLGTDWDPKHWRVNRLAMVNEMGRMDGELGGLARNRVLGRPYSISEYNHPAPNDFQAEMMPLYASFAAAQDWDAIYTFDYGTTGTGHVNNAIQGFFAHGTNPSKFGFYASSALIFRSGLIAPLRSKATLELPRNPLSAGFQVGVIWSKFGHQAMNYRTGVQLTDRKTWRETQEGPPDRAMQVIPGTGGQIWLADSPLTKSVVGFIRGKTTRQSGLVLDFRATGPEFASVTLVPRDGKNLVQSKHLLLTAVGRVENIAMGWDAKRESVSDQWGHGPTQIEVIPMQVKLKTSGPRTVWQLNGSGKRTVRVPTIWRSGILSFDTNGSKTMWWEITG